MACSAWALLRMGSFVPMGSGTFMHDVAEAEPVLKRISRRSQRYIQGKRIESYQMDALKSFISTRSLVILSRTSSLRGSALRLLSFRVRVQAQTQKATPQRSRQHVVSKPGGYPISFRSTVHAMPQNLQENVLRNTLQHATILSEAPWRCMNASFLLCIPWDIVHHLCRDSATWKGQVAGKPGRGAARPGQGVGAGPEWRCDPRVCVGRIKVHSSLAM